MCVLTCSVLVWNSLSSSSVRGRKLSSFSGYSCQPMAFSNLEKHNYFLLSRACVCVLISGCLQGPTGALPPGSWTGVQCLSHWGSRTDHSRGTLPHCRLWALGCCFHPDNIYTTRKHTVKVCRKREMNGDYKPNVRMFFGKYSSWIWHYKIFIFSCNSCSFCADTVWFLSCFPLITKTDLIIKLHTLFRTF